jgi:hypothetical protein
MTLFQIPLWRFCRGPERVPPLSGVGTRFHPKLGEARQRLHGTRGRRERVLSI